MMARRTSCTYADKAEGVDLRIEKDNGQVDAINRGFTRWADIVTWLNTDDVYSDPNALRGGRVAENPDVDVVYCRGRFVDGREPAATRTSTRTAERFTHSVGSSSRRCSSASRCSSGSGLWTRI